MTMNRDLASYRLYLDDVRTPQQDDWVVVRTPKAFRQTILDKEHLPKAISLDHDLGEGLESGYDIMHWLVDLALDHDLPLEDVDLNSHSANPVGRKNIESLFESWKRSKNKET